MASPITPQKSPRVEQLFPQSDEVQVRLHPKIPNQTSSHHVPELLSPSIEPKLANTNTKVTKWTFPQHRNPVQSVSKPKLKTPTPPKPKPPHSLHLLIIHLPQHPQPVLQNRHQLTHPTTSATTTTISPAPPKQPLVRLDHHQHLQPGLIGPDCC